MSKYARIYNNEVIAIRETSDQVLIDKLLSKEWWLPVDETTQQQEYDPKTQYLSANISYDIQETVVYSWREVIDYTEQELTNILESRRTLILNNINEAVNQYITGYYDIGTQQSFTGIYAKRDTSDVVRDYLDPVWDWISSILGYYYSQKQLIINSEDLDQLESITWDFSSFDATKPNVSLQDLISA